MMNEYYEANKRSLLLLTGVLFLLAIVLYVVLLHPMLSDLKRMNTSIEEKKSEKITLETQLQKLDDVFAAVDADQLIHEKKIPSDRLLDEYILNIQQLELTTNSKIESIQFAYDSSLAEDEDEESTAEETVENEGPDNDDGEETEDELTVDSTILQEKPEDLQVMTVRIEARSLRYKDFLSFIEAVENMERISIVTNLHFEQADEDDEFFSDDPLLTVPFEAEITTFYYTE